MKKKALITGITGQDGSYLAEFLLEKGYEVFGTVRRTSTINTERISHLLGKVNLIDADLLDQLSLIDAVKISDPTEVYNLASMSFVQTSWKQPTLTGEFTGLGVTKMLEAIRFVNPSIKFYQASSSEMFGKVQEIPQKETTPFYPRSPYGVAKLYGHWITVNYRESYKMFACSGILFNHECLSENTPIIIRKKKDKVISIKRLKDIRRPREKGGNIQQWALGDTEIWDGKEFVDLFFITATKRRKDNPDFSCKTINTRHGVVEATNHHNILLTDSTKIKSQDINIGHKLLHGAFPNEEGICELTKEEAVFLGMMVGDGYISENGKSHFTNSSREIMEFFEKLWMKVGLGALTKRSFKTEYGKAVQANLNGNSRYLSYIRNEIYTYDGFKKVPDRVLNANPKLKSAFLLGYNLTDGLKASPTAYQFKNFKTNSIILAQGLLFLVNQVTGQDYNITFEEDEKYYGYYSINLLSPIDNSLKEEKVNLLLAQGISQRQISMQTQISRKFIRKIANMGHAQLVHHLAKEKEEVKKVLYHRDQPVWVFDIETASGKLMAGIGSIVVSNSPRRGIEFVTRKISNAVARIHLGLQKEILLGNLDAKRDWGFAGDYVKAMWMMLQQKEAEDYVIATGKAHSVRDFVKAAFEHIGISNWENYVKMDKKFIRPAEVQLLIGDSTKARMKLGWKPTVNFQKLVQMMVDNDIELEKRKIQK